MNDYIKGSQKFGCEKFLGIQLALDRIYLWGQYANLLCHGSDVEVPVSNSGILGSISAQSMSDLWWTKWHCDRFISDYLLDYR